MKEEDLIRLRNDIKIFDEQKNVVHRVELF